MNKIVASFFARHKFLIFAALILSLAYFLTRLFNIMELPLFTDEAIYTRWSQIARYDASWRFISLTDGKQPSFVWFDMVFMRFITDPLFSGRLVSVFAGFFGMAGMFFLGKEIFKNTKIGLLSALLYLIYPFTLVYDRMALYESLITASTVWGIFFQILLVRRRRLDVALILGFIMGFGALTKSNAFFLIYLFPLSLLLFDWKMKNRIFELGKWASLALLSTLMTYGFYSVLRLSPFFHIIKEKTTIFKYPFNEWVTHPFEFLQGNLNGLLSWLIEYSTIPLLLLIFASFIVGRKMFVREKLFLLLWFLIPFVGTALFGRVLYPRFILPMTMTLLILGAYSIYYIWENSKNRLLAYAVFVLVLTFLIRSDFYVITDLARAPIAKADTDQFANEWPAGGGVREIVAFFREESKDKEIYVATEGTFGSLPTYATEIYLDEVKNIKKRGIWPTPAEIPEDLVKKAKTMRVFYVLNDSREAPVGWPVKLIAKYQKGIGNSYMSLYEVIPNR